MERDPGEILKAKAVLLLRRERELFQFRQERARTETWLDVFHVLSLELVAHNDKGSSVAIIDQRRVVETWGGLLIERLGFQCAAVYVREANQAPFRLAWGAPLRRLVAEVEPAAEAIEHLRTEASGTFDLGTSPAPAVAAIGGTLGIAKAHWVCLSANGREFLLVAGFFGDAAIVRNLAETDQGHFVMFTNHLAALLANSWLVGNLVDERSRLERSLDQLKVAQHQLVQVSRMAGMAEIATGVLHNVGNILTSVNVSSELVSRKLRESRTPNLRRAVGLLEHHVTPAATPEVALPRIVEYLRMLADSLEAEQTEIGEENDLLRKRIEHIKVVVAKQQEHARPMAVIELCTVRDLIADAIALVEAAYVKHQVELKVTCPRVPDVAVDRHLVLQILVNLLSNAKHAVVASPHHEKRVEVRAQARGTDRLAIEITDNGVGMTTATQGKLFTHGFTTKKHGHGFGLHNASLAAQAIGGTLTGGSAGEGQGATFTLELPLGGIPPG
jgi:two-component system, NtrC family, sensor kinase